jgi:hypothetical protein
MLRNTADCQADADRFITRIVGSEVVWYLRSKHGRASCESNDSDEDEPLTVLLFFSDEAYARRVKKQHFPDHEIDRIGLFDFLYRWLPGMTGDGVLAGPNWTGDLVGLEMQAYPLRDKIETTMTKEHLEPYKKHYEELTRPNYGGE